MYVRPTALSSDQTTNHKVFTVLVSYSRREVNMHNSSWVILCSGKAQHEVGLWGQPQQTCGPRPHKGCMNSMGLLSHERQQELTCDTADLGNNPLRRWAQFEQHVLHHTHSYEQFYMTHVFSDNQDNVRVTTAVTLLSYGSHYILVKWVLSLI